MGYKADGEDIFSLICDPLNWGPIWKPVNLCSFMPSKTDSELQPISQSINIDTTPITTPNNSVITLLTPRYLSDRSYRYATKRWETLSAKNMPLTQILDNFALKA